MFYNLVRGSTICSFLYVGFFTNVFPSFSLWIRYQRDHSSITFFSIRIDVLLKRYPLIFIPQSRWRKIVGILFLNLKYIIFCLRSGFSVKVPFKICSWWLYSVVKFLSSVYSNSTAVQAVVPVLPTESGDNLICENICFGILHNNLNQWKGGCMWNWKYIYTIHGSNYHSIYTAIHVEI